MKTLLIALFFLEVTIFHELNSLADTPPSSSSGRANRAYGGGPQASSAPSLDSDRNDKDKSSYEKQKKQQKNIYYGYQDGQSDKDSSESDNERPSENSEDLSESNSDESVSDQAQIKAPSREKKFSARASSANWKEQDQNQKIKTTREKEKLKVQLISKQYRSGKALIYDCDKGSFICVSEKAYIQCQKNRRKAFFERKKVFPCATIGVYKDLNKCASMQTQAINNPALNELCLRSTHYKHYKGG